MSLTLRTLAMVCFALGLAACGGGGDTGPGTETPPGNECGALQTCIERCYCASADFDGCTVACADNTGSGGSGAGGSTGGVGGVAGTGVGATAGTGPAGAAGTGVGGESGAGAVGGAGGAPALTAELSTISVTVPPGGEVFYCQNFRNPFGGKTVAVTKSESFMTPGSHHMFVFYNGANVDGGTELCSGLEYGTTIHSAARAQQSTTYPSTPRVARLVDGNHGFRTLVHFLNTTQQTQNLELKVVFTYSEDLAAIEAVAGSLFFNNALGINIDPYSPGVAAKACSTGVREIHIMGTSSHMHQYGTNFSATANGQSLYQTTQWSEPEVKVYDPPLVLPPGTMVDWRCDYQNNTPQTLTFGDSAKTNEMCIFAGTYFAFGGDGTTVGCTF